MKGKTAVVTGANSGIGQVTALEIARAGATLVMVCRNADKGHKALQEIKDQSGNPDVHLLLADLSVQADIRRLAEEIRGQFPRIHLLVNNAGTWTSERTLTSDGFETMFATNHLSYFLLTHLLLDPLKAAPAARVVNVASIIERNGRIFWDDLNLERNFSAINAYGQSKLANVMFTYELARRLAGTNITANALHPGAINSNLGNDIKGIFRVIINLARPFLLTPEKGAQTSVYLATSPEVEGVTGKYFINKKPAKTNPVSYDAKALTRLWEISEKMTEAK